MLYVRRRTMSGETLLLRVNDSYISMTKYSRKSFKRLQEYDSPN
jgi:hypothetical protein